MSARTSGTKKGPSKATKGQPGNWKNSRPPIGVVRAEWVLRLYVAGQTPKSLTAYANLKRLCEEHLADRYSIEVVDLAKQPYLAQNDQIVALPTLVRKLPEPIKRVIGDLSNLERVMAGIDIKPVN